MAWNTICRPYSFGGLGVKNLQVQALALRVRWEWLGRTNPRRPWQGLALLVDKEAQAVFNSTVLIKVGKGDRVLFWTDRWIHGFAVSDIAPRLVERVDTRTKNKRTVAEALLDKKKGALDFDPVTSFMSLLQEMHLRHAITTVHRSNAVEDEFTWPADPTGMYTTKSTYDRLCQGLVRSPTAQSIWRTWAPLKCKIFVWLAVQYRLWTFDRRARHGLQEHTSACFTCLQEEDKADHILVQCVYA